MNECGLIYDDGNKCGMSICVLNICIVNFYYNFYLFVVCFLKIVVWVWINFYDWIKF